MYPIDLRFAKTEKLTIEENGESKDLTVLVYDEKAAEDYYKRVGCFAAQLNELKIENAEDVESWHISSKFASHPAFVDMLPEIIMGDHHMEIYGIDVHILDDEREFVFLELPESKLEENNHWK